MCSILSFQIFFFSLCLGCDYGIYISVGRVYRLMRSRQLPPMSTIKPKSISRPKESSGCYADHLHQDFHQKAPNLVWTSDFTYLKAGGKWYYLCIIMDLFSRKIISWNISSKPNADLVIQTFQKAYRSRNFPAGLMFHSDKGLSLIHISEPTRP